MLELLDGSSAGKITQMKVHLRRNNMIKRLVSILTAAFILAGCASVPVTDLKRTDAHGDKRISDIASATKVMKPVGSLAYGKVVKITLDNKMSPILTQDAVDSRFELVEVAGKKDQPYTINVVASCDCLGFAKKSVAPVAYLLDAAGVVVAQEVPNERTEDDILYRMFKSLKGKFPADGIYYVAVVADYHGGRNIRVGDAVGYIGFIPFKKAIYQYPTGDVFLGWQAEQKTGN
ncbi:MAG: hypothetical protein Q8L69_14490 [Gallionellaceae bacterium]|nr:hypothetical protein [Gallionellaceae bacterium]